MKAEDYQKICLDLKKRRIPQPVKRVVTLMLDKKAQEVTVIKVKGISDITDYMILCHGSSSRQKGAIADQIQRVLKKENKLHTYGVEGNQNSEWILLDYVDFTVHIFSEEYRRKLQLEKLWMDAKLYSFYVDYG